MTDPRKPEWLKTLSEISERNAGIDAAARQAGVPIDGTTDPRNTPDPDGSLRDHRGIILANTPLPKDGITFTACSYVPLPAPRQRVPWQPWPFICGFLAGLLLRGLYALLR